MTSIETSRGTSRATPARPFSAALALVVLLMTLLVLVPTAWWEAQEHYALRELDAAERRHVFRHELNGMKALCSGETAGAFTARCQEQARFLDRFPECTGECRTLVEPFLPRPSR